MRYYDVNAVNGPLEMRMVPEDALRRLRRIFAEDGVQLDATHVASIPDKPVYRVTESGEYVPNDVHAADM